MAAAVTNTLPSVKCVSCWAVTCIGSQHVFASRIHDHVLHEFELYAGRRFDHHPHGKGNELPRGEGRCQEATPVAVRKPEEGAEEVVGGFDVQLCQQLHAKDVESCLHGNQAHTAEMHKASVQMAVQIGCMLHEAVHVCSLAVMPGLK